jgi:hypothetical protein
LEKCRALLAGGSAEEILGRPDVVSAAPGAAEDDGHQPTAPPVDGPGEMDGAFPDTPEDSAAEDAALAPPVSRRGRRRG